MNIPTKPQDVTFTDDQWRAIWADGRDLLVSAAAGSGKTKVLITRMIEKVLNEKKPIDVDELLVVTFTNAAAAEMRHRMAEALEEAIERYPSSTHLRRQLSLLNKAQISSLHSFCLQVVRHYAYVLNIDPGFRIADPTEAALLRDDTIAEVLEEAYAAPNPEAMYRLADSFTADRHDQAIELLIAKLYDYARVHPFPEQWLRAIPEAYQLPATITVDELDFISPLKQSILHTLEEARAMAEEVMRTAQMPEGPEPLFSTAVSDAKWIDGAIDHLKSGNWADAYVYFNTLKWVRAGAIKKDSCDEEMAERAKKTRDSMKKLVTSLQEQFFIRTPERLLDEIRLMAPLMGTLIELVITFGKRYDAVKNERGIVDFSDLEHFALAILAEEKDGQLVPSPIAEQYRTRFKEVLVDEYQDTNLLQEAIIQLVKSGEELDGNLFMVGDVKQSIYRFRLAEPGLFLSKYGRFTTDGTSTGLKIDLNANFRSRPEVLHATNYLFSQLMGERVGEIAYDDAAALKYGAQYTDEPFATGLTLLYEEEDAFSEDELSLRAAQVEARAIIRKIKEWMANGAEVTEAFGGKKRPLEYRDIVILLRSMTWSGEIAEQLKQAGIPVYVELSEGYFEAIEVMVMLNTLKVIDNPYQDIPFVSVLRSPFIGMTDDELAAVRLAEKNVPFFDALQTFVVQGGTGIHPTTQEKIQRFFVQFEDWRNLARRGSLAELIWQVYTDTHYYEMVGAMPNGKQRQANLRALHDRAMEYEKTSFRGLFRFLRFVDRMKKRGDDLGEAKYLSEKENVVRMMTIHSSKGLEFPYVFIAGVGRTFNKMDFNQSYLFDQHFGLAVKAIDPDKRLMYTSLPFLAMKEKKELEMRAEEMRILYVAMTRAKEQLELIASVKDLESAMIKWQDAQLLEPEEMLPEYLRSQASSYLDWIGPAIARHPDFEKFGVLDGSMRRTDVSRWRIDAISTSTFEQMEMMDKVEQERPISSFTAVDEALKQQVIERFTYAYPFAKSMKQPSKQSVSELKRLALLEQQTDEWSAVTTEQSQVYLHERPNFLKQKQLSAAEIGTAMHTIMQHLPLDCPMDESEIRLYLDTLVQRQLLTTVEASAVQIEQVVRFYNTSLAQRLKEAKRLYRELPFTYSLPTKDGHDHQLIQGIIDGLFEEQDGWVLVDYKTDRIQGLYHSNQQVQNAMQKRYGIQLSLYKQAIEAIANLSIKEMVVYVFDGENLVSIQEELV